MIGKIAGLVDYRAADHVLIDTGGVGYVVYCSERTLATLPSPGDAVALYTELLVREDLLQLFGFRTLAEREWHRLLTTVQGVGAKAGLAILGNLGADGVARALSLGDAAAIRSSPGIGPKLAQRIVLELQTKAPAVMAMGARGAAAAVAHDASTDPSAISPVPPLGRTGSVRPAVSPAGSAQARADALSALANLGYSEGEAAAAISGIEAEEVDVSALIRIALRALAPKG